MSALTKPILRSQVPGDMVPISQGYEPTTDQWLPLIVDAQGRTLIAGSVSVLGIVTVAIAAGANTIGNVGVSSLPVLPAGTNNIGDVDIVTMPAITGTVDVSSLPALPTGTNVIGHVVVDSAPAAVVSGSVSVSSLPATPAGANAIGTVGVTTLPSLPAGGNGIGSVIVSAMSALVAGVARIGKVTVRNAADSADIDPLAESTFTTRHPVVGQAAMAASMPVVLASNQASIPVAATVAAALPAGNNNIGDVDIASLPTLPAGTNNIGDVDVLTLPALPAGTNAIGKLATNAGINIGTVDVASMVVGTAATSLGKAEDGTHVSGDVGVMMLGVRQDAPSALSANGRYTAPSFDGNGAMYVLIQDLSIVNVTATATATAGAYAAGQVVGGLLTFAGVNLASGKPVTVVGVQLTDPSGQIIGGRLHLLTADLATPIGDKAAYNFVAGDFGKKFDVVDLANAVKETGSTPSELLWSGRKTGPVTGTSLVGYYVVGAAVTYGAVSLRFDLRIEQGY